jgi:large subunit ribosomal protein L30
MILVIRIAGLVTMRKADNEALDRLRVRRKYSAVLVKPTPENMKLIQHLRNFIAYGDITKETLTLLIQKRGQPIKKGARIDAKAVVEALEKKSLKELGLKPFFRLHPPVGGIDSKLHFGTSKKAVLGDNKSAINDLVRRML